MFFWQRWSVRLALLVLWSCTGETIQLEGLACDSGRCAEGYVCHPETNVCVEPVAIDCDGGGTCPSEIETGDSCKSVGSFIPCADNTTSCDQGCRTCGEDKTWGTCTDPVCADGTLDADPNTPGCQCASTGAERCNNLDDNCDGIADNFPSQPALNAACTFNNPNATDVSTWSCTGGSCAIVACNNSRADDDNNPTNGCEGTCVPTGSETCDGADNDCNGTTDDVAAGPLQAECQALYPVAQHVQTWACVNDTCAISICSNGAANTNGTLSDGCEAGCVQTSPSTEVCDGIDNDCSNGIDIGAADCITYFRDDDGDGFGQTSDSQCLCASSGAYTATEDSDCDDDSSSCGADCFPTNPASDLCNGEDNNCDGDDGEDEPGLGAGCDGADTDVCVDDVQSCQSGVLTCSLGSNNEESASATTCTDGLDNDCDGLIDCADSSCALQVECTGCSDVDGDGATICDTLGSLAAPTDCDDGIPTCRTDCVTNTDSAQESTAVVDCVEDYCGSDKSVGGSFCYIVNDVTQLIAAFNGSNSLAGRNSILINSPFTVAQSVPDLWGTGGVRIRSRPTATITSNFNEALLRLVSDGNDLADLRITYGAGTDRAMLVLSDNNTFANNTFSFAAADGTTIGVLVDIQGSHNTLSNLTIARTTNTVGQTQLRIAGVHNTLNGYTQTSIVGTNGTLRGLWVSGTDTTVTNVTQTLGLPVTGGGAAILVTGSDNSVNGITQTISAGVSGNAITISGSNVPLTNVTQTLSAAVSGQAIAVSGNNSPISGLSQTIGGAISGSALLVSGNNFSVTPLTQVFTGTVAGSALNVSGSNATVSAITQTFGAAITGSAINLSGNTVSLSDLTQTVNADYNLSLNILSGSSISLTNTSITHTGGSGTVSSAYLDITGLNPTVTDFSVHNTSTLAGSGIDGYGARIWNTSDGGVFTNIDFTFDNLLTARALAGIFAIESGGHSVSNLTAVTKQSLAQANTYGQPNYEPGAGLWVRTPGSVIDNVTMNFQRFTPRGVHLDDSAQGVVVSDVILDFDAAPNGALEIDAGAVGAVVSNVTITIDNTLISGANTTQIGIRQAGLGALLEDVTLTIAGNMTSTPGPGAAVILDGFGAIARNVTVNYAGQLRVGAEITGGANVADNFVFNDTLADANYMTDGFRVRTGTLNRGDDNFISRARITSFKTRAVLVANPDATCSQVTTEKAERNAIYNSVFTGGTDAAADFIAGILVCDALDTRIVGNVITGSGLATSSDGIQMIDNRPLSPDSTRINFIDQNTIVGTRNGIQWLSAPSDNNCVRDNIFGGHVNNAISLKDQSPDLVISFSSESSCTAALTNNKWGNYAAATGESQRCGGDCVNIVSGNICACLPTIQTDFFEFSTAPRSDLFLSTTVTDPTYMCLNSATTAGASLVDVGHTLGPTDSNNALFSVYDRNGTSTGQFVDSPGALGSGPDIGAREKGAGDCP